VTQFACVAIVGLPNAGKSTLLNYLVGEKLAPVHRKAQMTRKNILGICTRGDVQIAFLDTPGLTDIDKPLNRLLKKEMQTALSQADIILVLQDVLEAISPRLEEIVSSSRVPLLLALNKIDAASEQQAISTEILRTPFAQVFRLSALTGDGVDALWKALAGMASEGPHHYADDDLTDVPVRDLAAEIIREHVMQNLHEEIPYEAAVHIESYKEEAALHHIKAVIVVNKNSQKGMVIGKGGATLKKIGTAARQDLVKLAGAKVHLSLFVKVDENWIKNDRKVRDYL
jgi:GTP-binding protein Era